MNFPELMQDPLGKKVFLVGIKGTGLCALAEILHSRGCQVQGSDVEDRFYTDEILEALGIGVRSFQIEDFPRDSQAVVYSTAYSPEQHPQLLEARKLGIPVLGYHEALGEISRWSFSAGISGVHGKTTSTGMVGALLKSLDLPVTVLAGSAVSNFDGRSTLQLGKEIFVAETCEYQRHFLHFHPSIILVTSIEADHLDYFRDADDVQEAFREYVQRLPQGGTLIYCEDDAGARNLGREAARARPDLKLIPYGWDAQGDFRIDRAWEIPGVQHFYLQGFFQEFSLRVPGTHNVRNAAGALALSAEIHHRHRGENPNSSHWEFMAGALAGFRGSRRRSEVLGESGGVLYMDDYGHHPTAIRSTLEGLRKFYPNRRLVVDFMSHTYSRTKALLQDFAQAFSQADLLLVNEIYASAREEQDPGFSSEDFFRAVEAEHPNALYLTGKDAPLNYLRSELRPGDLFITMGAGDNWKISHTLYREAAKP